MPLPKSPRGEAPTSFQKLDREWAHNAPGEFHTGAITERDQRDVTAAYWAMCELIDDQVGRILKTLDESGERENTIIIFMSDHGEMLGDHGLYFKGPHFYDEAIRVPLVISWPARFQRNHRVSGLVELIDLLPTLLDACGSAHAATRPGPISASASHRRSGPDGPSRFRAVRILQQLDSLQRLRHDAPHARRKDCDLPRNRAGRTLRLRNRPRRIPKPLEFFHPHRVETRNATTLLRSQRPVNGPTPGTPRAVLTN